MKYVRLYSDPQGESHFEETEVEFTVADFAPPSPPLNLSPFMRSSQMVFLSSPAGWQGSWHPTPERQFLVLVRGQLEIEASDGEVRRLKPGDVLLGEDLGGKGHCSRSLGPQNAEAVIVQLPR